MAAGDTKNFPCTCKHEYQDAKYGKGQRVFISGQDGNYKCTVCLRSNSIKK